MLSYIPHSKPTISEIDSDFVNSQLKSNLLAKGAKVNDFETLISKANNVKYTVCTSSGSTALQVVLKALNLQINSEIIIPSYVCESVYNAIVSLGYIPVLCDIETSWVVSLNTIRKKISSRTSAIVLVHLYGIDAWEDSLSEVGLPIIEDFCQGFALHTYTKRELKGIAGFCSFHATKCLTTGEGGAIITNSEELYDASRKIIERKVVSSIFSDFQASIGISQISQYDTFIQKRNLIAKSYFAAIKNKKYTEKIYLIQSRGIFFRYLLFGDFNVDNCIANAQKYGIAIRRGVDRMLHKTLNYSSNEFKNTELVFQSTLSIPIYPGLNEEEKMRVINFINGL